MDCPCVRCFCCCCDRLGRDSGMCVNAEDGLCKCPSSISEEDEGFVSDSSEDMDGDAESALASAGFGTDEDYGYYGEDDGDW